MRIGFVGEVSGIAVMARLYGEVRAARHGRLPDPMTDHRSVRTDPLTTPHAASALEVGEALSVDPAIGLGASEVLARAAQSGPNELEPARRESLLRMVLGAASEPFVVLLAVAGALAIALGEVRDGLLVIGGLIPIVGADVVTGYRGERALEALRDASAPMARVRRGGEATDVAAASLVPGDVILLRAGDVVPADGRLVRAERLLLDRSALTGESVPEGGAVGPDAADAGLADRRSIAYSGTSVVGGRGEAIVVATGRSTEVGRIAAGLASPERRRSPLQQELDRLVRILVVVALALIVIVTGLGFLRGQDAGANILAGISAAIAAIPEEPPILLAVILGLGAYRLLKRGVLIRRLNAEETLGAIDLILTDKTGTLTENRLDLASIRTVDGPVEDEEQTREILELALRAEDDAWGVAEGATAGSFTRAIGRALEAAGGSTRLARADLLDSAGVDDTKRYTWTRSRRAGRVVDAALGAPEAVIELATAGSPWSEVVGGSIDSGERLLALASRSGDDDSPPPYEVRAILGFADPLRPGIGDALRLATEAGIQTLVVTGDHPGTARAIGLAAGLDVSRVVTGKELETWDDERMQQEIGGLDIVARSTPDQKERLVRAARAAGRMVAVTGDGVNDAPALHGADVAIAMGSGTAVAREASDLVLGDDSFVTLMYGLAEGRRIVDNVRKGLVFLVSTHVALLGFLLIATIAGFGQPLLPIQILWLELFIDLSTSVAFEREPAEPDLMRRRPRSPGEPLLSAGLLLRIAAAGGFSAFAALGILLFHDGEFEHVRWVAFTALVCGQAVRAYANRSLAVPLRRLGSNRLLFAACVAVVVVQAAIPYLAPLAEAFRATPLTPEEWLLAGVVALAPALLAEIVRTWRGRMWVA
jgi:Ca2+-transporting ATPase